MSLRDSSIGDLKVPLTWAAGVALVVAILVAATLLLTDRRETFRSEAYGVTRQVTDRVAAPVGGVLSTPGRWVGQGVDYVRGYFFAVSENRRLKAELKEAYQWRDVAIALRDTNDRYKTLLGLRTDPPIPMVAARVVTDSRGPFANSRLANAGKEKGVKDGNPVMSENGLVGRVIGVTTGASRILLLTDIASRVPVMVDRTNARAILTGDGGPSPQLGYLRGQDPVKEGDRILTSGDGGLMPRGLPVGFAMKGLDGRWRVELASDQAPIDYVRILLFQDFAQLVNEAELNRMTAPPPAGGPPVLPAPSPAPTSATPGAAAAPKPPAVAAAPAVPPSSAAAKPPTGATAKPSTPATKPPASASVKPPSAGAATSAARPKPATTARPTPPAADRATPAPRPASPSAAEDPPL